MKLFTYYRYRLIFSAGRARARAPSSTSSSSTSLSSSSSSGRSTRVNSSRAPCSSVQEELLRQRRNQRQSEAIKRPSSFQEAINETHLLEKELLGGRDGALRLEIAARLMRETIRGVIRGAIRGNLRPSEAIRGNQAGAPRLQLAWAFNSICRRFSSEAHAAATAACGKRGWGGRRDEHLHARAGPQ